MLILFQQSYFLQKIHFNVLSFEHVVLGDIMKIFEQKVTFITIRMTWYIMKIYTTNLSHYHQLVLLTNQAVSAILYLLTLYWTFIANLIEQISSTPSYHIIISYHNILYRWSNNSTWQSLSNHIISYYTIKMKHHIILYYIIKDETIIPHDNLLAVCLCG